MLAPHNGEDSELGEVRFPAEYFFDAVEFLRGEAVFLDQFWCYGWIDNPEMIGAREIFRSRRHR